METRRRRSKPRKKKLNILKFVRFIIILIIILFLIKNWTEVKSIFSGGKNTEVADKIDIFDYDNKGKVLGKYSEAEFKEVLSRAKEKFEYTKGVDLLLQLKKLQEYIPEVSEIIDNYNKIPEDAIRTLLMFPENFLWTHGFINKPTNKAGLTGDEKKMYIPYLSQTDSRWGYKEVWDSTLGVVGCGPTSMSMVVIGLTGDYSQTPDKMMDYVINNNYFTKNVGTNWSFMVEAPKDFGLKSSEIPLNKNIILKELNQGNFIIASMARGDFTYGGHFIVLVAEQEGQIRVFDPNSWINTEKTWSYERIAPQIKNLWVISK